MLKSILKKAFPALAAYYQIHNRLIWNENSYLHLSGWMESLKRGYPCEKNGEELPWMNYSIIAFLKQRLRGNLNLFEYGSGYSTLFYARLVSQVTSVESDKIWYEVIKKKIPENVNLIFKEANYDGDYCRSIKLNNQSYDAIIIDGRDRVNCLKQSLAHLTEQGVIILDDSQREQYLEGINHAQEKGFLTLDFEGLKPTDGRIHKTTILYRRNNCLEI